MKQSTDQCKLDVTKLTQDYINNERSIYNSKAQIEEDFLNLKSLFEFDQLFIVPNKREVLAELKKRKLVVYQSL